MSVGRLLKKGIRSLGELDDRESTILAAIFQVQISTHKGISWGELWKLETIQKKMARQTFSHRLKALLERGLIEREVINNRRGKPTLYRINPKLSAELEEFSIVSPEKEKVIIEKFAEDVESLDTEHYVEAMMELALLHMYMWPIALTVLESEGARWLFFEANYQLFEKILGYIQSRAWKNNAEKEQALNKMFEFLEPFAHRSIGERFGMHDLYNLRQRIIEASLSRTEE